MWRQVALVALVAGVAGLAEYADRATPPPPAQATPAAAQTGDVAPAGDMEQIIFAAADQFGIDRSLARAVLAQESGGDPRATSRVGAAGLMQVMPATAAGIAQDLGIVSYDLYDPVTNATFGMYYLAQKIQRYGVAWGLAAYNWGPSAVDRFLARNPEAHGMEWDSVVAAYGGEIPGETQRYVTNILDMAAQRAPAPAPSVPQAHAVGEPYLLQGAVGANVLAALNANGGALQAFTIAPGQTWSFGHSIAPISALGPLPVVCGPAGCFAGGGWCDLSALYVKVADQLGLTSRFPAHIGVSDARFPGILLDEWGNGDDLTIHNPTDRTVTFQTRVDGDRLVIEGGF